MELREKFLHHIWDQRHLIPDLKTVSGKSLKIVYQGQYNTFNGPDFKNVIINLDGETIKGDIEIHLKTYDWTAHHHQEDPAYNNTILHVVLEHKSNLNYTIREDSVKIEILELQNQMDSDIEKLFVQYSEAPLERQTSICDFFKLTASDQLLPLLKQYGWERFIRKCNRFNAELHFDGFDQLLYNGFMEAMGYEKNKFNTLSIANHYKWNDLMNWCQQGLNQRALLAIWLNYSSLLELAENFFTVQEYSDIKRAFEYQAFSTEKVQINWSFFRIRPANHPVIRITQASSIVFSLLSQGFLKELIEIFNQNELQYKTMVERISNLLKVQNINSSKIGQLGNTLLLTIIGNIFLPIIYLYSEKTHNSKLMQTTKNIYHSFRPLGDNYVISFMKGYLDEQKWKLVNSSFINQQGLMHIYYRYCNYRLCDLCVAEKEQNLMKL